MPLTKLQAAAKEEVFPAERIGIYFNLPFEDYLADHALGSSDLRNLRISPHRYWHESWMNPSRKRSEEPHLVRGTAMHTMALEGEGAFRSRYLRGPDHNDDMTPSEKAALTKASKRQAEAQGMEHISAADYERIVDSQKIFHANPEIRDVFTQGFAEVSVFWERDGVRRKARLDYIKPRGVGDLKTCANTYNGDFPTTCRFAIMNHRYDIQAAHYLEARAMMPKLWHDNHVAGLPADQLAQLASIVKHPGNGWYWVFFCTVGTPEVFSYILRNDNPIIENAVGDIELAVSRYVRFWASHKTDPWIVPRPAEDLYMDIMPFNFARRTQEEEKELAVWMHRNW